ncbi:MAG: hypothetical protein COT92_02625 [Candidatus Doudnabacteria bacterium CG10_big_fil_rev_8_21_14_0_10_42_18]|uniref:Transglutaminase-like domain-containing protein n=1 Tax=Candidatus Doudnabacteria bacterium CG10_big_fil_rev_8_21_14_0_10_42_18 TaxID=1974552 RepID=A0A2H0VAR8_9BACT|nr:MAG: hypothetical protein COT92_02625 [Candidatus Doudnabacteria bacterium CG10_big_fil_rev_8_21_14_0_10_42_18]
MNNKFGYADTEIKLLNKLNSPKKIQNFLDTLKINFEENGETVMSPRFVIKTKKAHCMEGALLAAAALEFHGHRPLLVDLKAKKPDYDHVLAVYRQFGCFGSITKTNHAILRYREPVYKSVRELVMSYFHEYVFDNGKKTLREYSGLFDLKFFNYLEWRTSGQDLFEIPHYLDKIKHYRILNKKQLGNLRKADPIELKALELIDYKFEHTKF